jgi:beta-fructofuranosidase
LGDWEALDPISSPGRYSEMEVPQVYQDTNDSFELVFSSSAKYDFSDATRHTHGLIGLTSNDWNNYSGAPHVLLPEESGLYACRIVPELDGEIVGFDIKYGGIRRSGIKTHLRHVNRNFSDIEYNL